MASQFAPGYTHVARMFLVANFRPPHAPFSLQGLYELDQSALKELKPDVILTQSLCSVCSIDLVHVERVVSRMKDPRVSIVNLNPMSLQDVIEDCMRVGEAVGLKKEAGEAALKLQARVDHALALAEAHGPVRYKTVRHSAWACFATSFPLVPWMFQARGVVASSH